MRPLLIIIFCVYCSIDAFAQYSKYCPPLYGKIGDKRPYHITAGYGVTKLYGDINNNTAIGSAATLQFDYQVLNGLYIGIESQAGVLRTDVKTTADPRQSENDYLAGGLVATIHPFEMILGSNQRTRNPINGVLNSIFVGLGALYVINNYDNIYRSASDFTTYGPIAAYDQNNEPIFETRTNSFVFPSLNFGLNIPLINVYDYEYTLSLIIKGQLNYANNELLDGYVPHDSQGVRYPSENDMYNYYSLGIRYSF